MEFRKIRARSMLTVFLICAIILVANKSYQYSLDVYAQTNDGDVYLYEDNSSDSDIICVLKDGYDYKVIRSGAVWTKIRVDDDTVGYVASDSIRLIEDIEEQNETDYTVCVALGKIQAGYISAEDIIIAQSEYETEVCSNIEKIKEYKVEVEECEVVTVAVSGMSDDVSECLDSATADYEDLKEGATTLADDEKQTIVDDTVVQTIEAEEIKTEAVDIAAEVEEERQAIVDYACSFVGILKYVYGGTSLVNGADCSGFTQAIYKAYGYSIPRTSAQQRSCGTAVSYSEMTVGDLVCFSGHVGIYIGDDKFVHSPHTGQKVKISTLSTYSKTVKSIRRIIT